MFNQEQYIIVKEYFELQEYSCIEIARVLDMNHSTVVMYFGRYLMETNN
jgi:DNA-binding CsgD family transcriptional regulator